MICHNKENGKMEYVINKNEAKDILNICFKSYKAGSIDADVFNKKIFLIMCRRVDFANCEKKSAVDVDTWNEVLLRYLDLVYERSHQATSSEHIKTKITEDEYNNALLSIHNPENKGVDFYSFSIIVGYVRTINDEKTINEVAQIITNEEKLKEKAYLCCKMFLATRNFICMHSLDFDLCCKMIEFSLYAEKKFKLHKISGIGALLIKAIAYMILGEKENFLQQYIDVLDKTKATNKNNWADINKETLEILYTMKVWTLPSQEFLEITESYVEDIEISFKDIPSYDNVCEYWYHFLLNCLQHCKDLKKRETYACKLNKVKGKIYGLEIKK